MVDEETLRRIIKESVYETLTNLGFDVRNIQETQADMIYLRHIRKGSEELFSKGRLAIFLTTLTAGIYLLWDAIKNKIKNG